MQYRRLGDAGMKVSTIALGGWINYGEGKVPQQAAEAVVRTAYERGISLYDLADVYGHGEAEKQMGAMLAQYPRHTLVISTKVYFPMSDDVNDRGLSRKHIFESIAQSLRRLGTDYVDIYFCHRPDEETPIAETAHAMHDLITQGKVLYWGTSMWSAAQLDEAFTVCARDSLYQPRVEQSRYSMLTRERVEDDILPLVARHGAGVVAFSPLAQGTLTGKYDESIPPDTRFAREGWAAQQNLTTQHRDTVRRLAPIATRLGISRSQLALAWALRQPSVSSVITGATTANQVADNARAGDLTLDAETLREIEGVLRGKA